MANKTIPMILVRRILQLMAEGQSHRAISKACKISRNTVKQYIWRLRASEKTTTYLLSLCDEDLSAYSMVPVAAKAVDNKHSDLIERLPTLAERLQNPKVTRMILWKEYHREVPQGYKYTQFCEYLSRYLKTSNAVMHLEHQPAEELYFDFAGDTLHYVDVHSGERISCPVFIAVLPFSSYTYVEALPSAKREQLLSAMSNALKYFGGVPASMKSDNMAQYVKKANSYEPELDNLALQWSTH